MDKNRYRGIVRGPQGDLHILSWHGQEQVQGHCERTSRRSARTELAWTRTGTGAL